MAGMIDLVVRGEIDSDSKASTRISAGSRR